MIPREKIYIDLHKKFLQLHYQIAEYEKAGIRPPDDLWKKLKDIERKLRVLSRALENS